MCSSASMITCGVRNGAAAGVLSGSSLSAGNVILTVSTATSQFFFSFRIMMPRRCRWGINTSMPSVSVSLAEASHARTPFAKTPVAGIPFAGFPCACACSRFRSACCRVESSSCSLRISVCSSASVAPKSAKNCLSLVVFSCVSSPSWISRTRFSISLRFCSNRSFNRL